MIFGWDISTSIIGVTVFDQAGLYVASEYLDLRELEANLLQKAEESEIWIKEILSRYVGDGHFNHFVEDRLGNFAFGKSMLQTLMKLAAFNSVVSYIIYKASFHTTGMQSVSIDHIHPTTVKSLMKKEGLEIPKGGDKKALTLQYVQNRQPTFPISYNRNGKPQPWCYDMSDSYIVARAGLRKFGCIR